jgi:hypothetical protein
MARDWSKEPYRKLMLRPSSSFKRVSLLAQAVFYVLIREADDDGRLAFDADWSTGVSGLCRMLGVAPRDRRIVAARLEELVADGCLTHVGDVLVVSNLAAINVRRDRRSGPQSEPGPASTERQPAPTVHQPSVDRASTEREPNTSLHEPRVESVASSRDDSPDLRTRARSQVGREVGREVDLQPPQKLTPTAEEIRVELERARTLFGDEDLARTAARLDATLAGDADPRINGVVRRQVAIELVAHARSHVSRFTLATPDQLVAQLDQKLVWLTREIRLGRWDARPQSRSGQRPPQESTMASDPNAFIAAVVGSRPPRRGAA